jgi:PIN domain nuclease of toxin-antitoxin system
LKNQYGEDKDYILDSSAFLNLFEDEKEAEIVQELLERAKKSG